MIFPVPDQKSNRTAQLLTEEVVPTFGVPETLLSDRGMNLSVTPHARSLQAFRSKEAQHNGVSPGPV